MSWLNLALIGSQIILGCFGQQKEFPSDFLFGSVTTSFAVEGAWDADGKQPSIWDYFAHNYTEIFQVKDPSYNITEKSEIAADSYHRWEDDIKVAKDTGLDFYRFSICWSRLLPTLLPNDINQAAVDYYNNLINGLIAANIIPVINLLHYDTPAAADKFLGGFTNDITIDGFVGYADVIFKLFGDRVKNFITFTSPYRYCKVIPQLIADISPYFPTGYYEYLCAHNVLLAHAKTYTLYQSKYKKTHNGNISISLTVDWYEPASESSEDIEAAKRAMDFSFGWFAHPLIHGNYPKRMIDTIADLSKKQNLSFSRLPTFTAEQIEEIKGTLDYVTVIPTHTYLAADDEDIAFPPKASNDVLIKSSQKDEWKDPNSPFVSTPLTFRKAIKYVADNYNGPKISIADHGYGAFKDSLNDTLRVKFLQDYLEQVLLLIHEDQVNIHTYDVWSLIDEFFFEYALEVKSGLAYVDFNDPNRPRTLKESAKYLKSVIDSRKI